MGDALNAYREIVCKANGHAHGEKGLLDCLLAEHAKRLQQIQQGSPTKVA